MDDKEVDVLIVGGGLIGATLLLAIKNLGFQALLVEAQPFEKHTLPDFDARSLALSNASVMILKTLDLWPLMESAATPIERIHVSQQHAFGTTHLSNEDRSPLGYVVEMQHIHHALHQKLPLKQVLTSAELIELDARTGLATLQMPKGLKKVKAKMMVAADGADSSVRRLCGLKAEVKAYAQHALVANIGLARPHHQEAYERFTPFGPLAMLPMMHQRVSMVWSLRPKDALRLKTSPEKVFLKELQLTFGYRLGRFVKVGQRVIFPLKKVLMSEQIHGAVVFVGNAAHTLHPVAAQGFNLGLRDVATLAQFLANEGLTSEMLLNYQKARRFDQNIIVNFADGLIDLFGIPGLSKLRGIGLAMMDKSNCFKKMLKHYTSGYAGISADLVCGIPLERSS